MDEILKDARFAHIPRDPAFKRIPKKERKVKIDKRFQSMFSDKRFKVKYTVDKRGKPVRESSTENLRRYYALETSSESEEESSADDLDDRVKDRRKNKAAVKSERPKGVPESGDNSHPVKSRNGRKSGQAKKASDRESSDDSSNSFQQNRGRGCEKLEVSSNDDDDDDDDDTEGDSNFSLDINDELDRGDNHMDPKIRSRLQDLSVDYARGEGAILSDSSSDEESSDEEGKEEEVEHGWGELDQDAERTEESTHRLAVCNINWDRISAQDLMVLLSSFVPKGGVIHSVTVYPSEFGMRRMQEEEEKGPLELRGERSVTVEDSDAEEDDKKEVQDEDDEVEGSQYQREQLRQYQLHRLRYFYAVVVCDCVATADSLYKECDGMEYESSASHLDLRFIPDGTSFEQEPRETCTELPNLKKYEPQLFITTALQQSKVQLTWDETDPRRRQFNEKINSGKVDDLDENDLKVYLATSSSEEEASDKEDGGKEENASKYRALLQSIESQEEETKKKDMEMQVTWGIDLKQKVDRRLKDGKADDLTPFQKYLQKRKEKKKAQREEQLKKKRQFKEEPSAEDSGAASASEDEVPSDIDMKDAYFKEEFEGEEFVHTKKTKSKNKKNRRKKGGDESEDEETKHKKAELELLLMDEDDNKKHFSLKDILVEDTKNKKKKKKKLKEGYIEKKVDEFEINVQDDRFSALFTSHLYNIDPADPHYKKTKGMEALRQEKLSRRRLDEEISAKRQKVEVTVKKQDPELSLLVKNVKRKSQIFKK